MFKKRNRQIIQRFLEKRLSTSHMRFFRYSERQKIFYIIRMIRLRRVCYFSAEDTRNPFPYPLLLTKKAQYFLLNQIGEGQTSEVYKALNLINKRYVAIKDINDINKDLPEFDIEEECGYELEIAEKVKFSLDCAKIFNVKSGLSPRYFLVMPQFNCNLDDYIAKNPNLGYKDRLEIALKAAKELSKVHNFGIIHNDMQPTNVLLNPKSGKLAICDFGFSRYSNESKAPDIIMFVAYVLHYVLTGKTIRSNGELLNGVNSKLKAEIFEPVVKTKLSFLYPVTLDRIINVLEDELSIVNSRDTVMHLNTHLSNKSTGFSLGWLN